MEDVVALKVKNKDGSSKGFLAWGRIYDRIDSRELIEALRRSLRSEAAIVEEITLCDSLAEVSHAKYFYEGLLSFAWQPIPFGANYEQWRAERQREYDAGNGAFSLVGELGS